MDLAAAARLVGEPARATMLEALLGGQARPAGELARLAGVSAPTASEHLTRLRAAGLVEAVPAGRHRYYRLASAEVAQALEALSLLADAAPVRSLRQSREDIAQRAARTCYDHLAGQLGVALHDALIERGALAGYEPTDAGRKLFTQLGVAVPAGHRPLGRPCLDRTERRPHLAGPVGRGLCAFLLDEEWVRRVGGGRALRITDLGRRCLADRFGVTVPG